MFTISKSFSFEAAHSLPSLPEGHKCKRPHGPSYTVTLELKSKKLDAHGFVADYGHDSGGREGNVSGLGDVGRWIAGSFDHRDLNDVLTFQTTVENLAKWIYDYCRPHLPQLSAVRVSETPKTWAEYRP
jgi:6-pyruvoyltetrahydropterin/6-carboxytetrahydropterin synthase